MAKIGPNARNAWTATNDTIDLTRDRVTPRRISVLARPQALALDLTRSACVIVDMQNDFGDPGGWLASLGVDVAPTRSVVGPLRTLLGALRQESVPVIWLNWGNRPDRANLPPGVLHVYDPRGQGTGIGAQLPGNGSRVLERGSWSASLVQGLSPEPEDVWVDKYRMSGFFDTELDSVLRNLDVTTVMFGGVNLDQCVYATLADAACLGYDAVLLADCSATTSPAFCVEATLYNVAQCFGFVARGADVVAAIGAVR
jgi:ureidoacrylate peracid hydrolase